MHLAYLRGLAVVTSIGLSLPVGVRAHGPSPEAVPAAKPAPLHELQCPSVPVRGAPGSDARLEAQRALKDYGERLRCERSPAFGFADPEEVAAFARVIRPELILHLDDLAEEAPADDWIVGHRVGLRVQQGNLEDALAVALGCMASEWWCAALTGFVLHLQGRILEAEAAFDRALERAPYQERCAWLEALRYVVDADFARSFARMPCAAQMQVERRIWWLADPFHLWPGNDRRTEHYSRIVAMRLHHEELHLHPGLGPCRETHHSGVIRWGWPDWWWGLERAFTARGDAGHAFLPGSRAIDDPLRASANDWDLSLGPHHERFEPGVGPIYELDSQIAFFQRGDSALVLAATDLGRHPLALAPRVDVGVALSRHEDDVPTVTRAEGASLHVVLRATVPNERHLVSLEAFAPDRAAARVRFAQGFAASSTGQLSISDLLIFDWTEGMAEELDSVAPRMLGTKELASERDVGVFWEMYGVEPGDALDLSIVAKARDVGLLRRVGQILRIVPPTNSLRFAWEEYAEGGELISRFLRLDLAALRAGEYTLEVQARSSSGQVVTAVREVDLHRGS